MDDGEVARLEVRDPVRIGFEVVQHHHMGDSKFPGDLGGIDSPGKIGRLGASIAHDSWNAEPCCQHRLRVMSQKLADHGVQARVACAREALFAQDGEGVSRHAEEGEVGLRAADVASEDEVLLGWHYF